MTAIRIITFNSQRVTAILSGFRKLSKYDHIMIDWSIGA